MLFRPFIALKRLFLESLQQQRCADVYISQFKEFSVKVVQKKRILGLKSESINTELITHVITVQHINLVLRFHP